MRVPAILDKPNVSSYTYERCRCCLDSKSTTVHSGPGVKRRPLAEPMPGLPTHVLVRDSEEKGSDVNLATRLLVDGFKEEYEQAVVVSNDADFAGAMRYVRDELRLRVALVNPDSKAASPRDLAHAATYVKRLWKSHLRRSQLPSTLADEVGSITKPAGW